MKKEKTLKTLTAGCIGNLLEWYDFALYGFFAPVIAKLFFPSDDHLISLMVTFGVFAMGFLMRPVGSLLFGILGDMFGRKRALEISVIMMAVPTTLIGILPTEADIGLAAPILLIVLRLFQGISIGGEFTGSVSFVIEHAPPGRRGFFGSWTVFTVFGGILLGSGISSFFNHVMSSEDIENWGWRIPFLLGIFLGLYGLYLRRGLEESPAFINLRDSGQLSKTPLKEAFRDYWRSILTLVGATYVIAVNFYMIFVYLATYLSEQTNIPHSDALDINTISMVVLVILTPAFGYLSDKFGRKPFLICGSLIIGVFALPLFILLSKQNVYYDLLSQLVFAIGHSMISGPFAAFMVEMFPARIRMSAISIGYNTGVGLLGGSVPLIATFLIRETGSNLAPGYYLALAAFVSLIVYISIKETFRNKV